jgi:hypothetical protein
LSANPPQLCSRDTKNASMNASAHIFAQIVDDVRSSSTFLLFDPMPQCETESDDDVFL